MSKPPVIVIGIGEMGAVFARAFLKSGHPVYPVNRDTDMDSLASEVPDPEMVLVAVGEKDLVHTLEAIPNAWHQSLALLQNELLPRDFDDLPNPTVISVWFEKKKGQDSKVIIPSPAFGPMAKLLEEVMASIDIPVKVLSSEEELLFELVVKNLYILTSNIAGIKTGGNVGELWDKHQDVMRNVANDILKIQEALTESSLDHEAIIKSMKVAFDGDPEHKCMGRSAPARLERALAHADHYDIDTPALREISDGLST